MLTLLCVTKAEPHAAEFLRDLRQLAKQAGAESFIWHDDRPSGILEDIHDAAIRECPDGYILRLDDDERCSPAMVTWLLSKQYETHDHWKFPRANLFGTNQTVLGTPQLWPDCQTRLSIKSKAGGRNHIHAGSTFGGGELAPVAIEHHKFLVKTVDERRAIATRYDAVLPGAGTGPMLAFSLPEEAYAGQTVPAYHLGDGRTALIEASKTTVRFD